MKHIAETPITHNGQRFKIGNEVLGLDEESAARLLSRGKVKVEAVAAPDVKTPPTSPAPAPTSALPEIPLPAGAPDPGKEQKVEPALTDGKKGAPLGDPNKPSAEAAAKAKPAAKKATKAPKKAAKTTKAV